MCYDDRIQSGERSLMLSFTPAARLHSIRHHSVGLQLGHVTVGDLRFNLWFTAAQHDGAFDYVLLKLRGQERLACSFTCLDRLLLNVVNKEIFWKHQTSPPCERVSRHKYSPYTTARAHTPAMSVRTRGRKHARNSINSCFNSVSRHSAGDHHLYDSFTPECRHTIPKVMFEYDTRLKRASRNICAKTSCLGKLRILSTRYCGGDDVIKWIGNGKGNG